MDIWFSESGDSKVGKVSSLTGAVSEYAFGNSPKGIVEDLGGNIWVADYGLKTISQLSSSGVVLKQYTLSYRPSVITRDQDGAIWSVASGKVTMFDPASSSTSPDKTFTIPASTTTFGGITEGPDGNIWFTDFYNDKIWKVDPSSGSMTGYAASYGSSPQAITVGADGNLWFVANGSDQIGRITTSGIITMFNPPGSGGEPLGIAAGPDGNIWYTRPDVSDQDVVGYLEIDKAAGWKDPYEQLCGTDEATATTVTETTTDSGSSGSSDSSEASNTTAQLTAAPSPQESTTLGKVTVSNKKVRASKKGIVRVTLSCSGGQCEGGKIVLLAAGKKVTTSKTLKALSSGSKKSVSLRLTEKALKKLRKTKSRRLKLKLSLTPSGASATAAQKTALMVLAPRRN